MSLLDTTRRLAVSHWNISYMLTEWVSLLGARSREETQYSGFTDY